MKNKLLIAGIAAAAAVALIASPAMATTTPAGPFGDLNTFNATGGTSMTDGLKVDIAQGQIQVTNDGVAQFFPTSSRPGTATSDVNNYFTVAYNDGATHTISPLNGPAFSFTPDLVWDSATSSATPTDAGKSGKIVNTLTSEETGHGIVTLEITFAYTYPDDFVNVSTKLTLPVGWTYPTRVYWNADSTLGGSDAGNQLEGTLTNGQTVRGVISPDGTQIEAFRQVVGQNQHSWAGAYNCPWSDSAPDCIPTSIFGWAADNTDAPDAIAVNHAACTVATAETDCIDNGFGVSVPVVNAAGDHTASFDILFVSCLGGVTAIQCIDGALNPAAVEDPTLAHTGINATQGGFLAAGAAVLALVGGGLVIARRRKLNN